MVLRGVSLDELAGVSLVHIILLEKLSTVDRILIFMLVSIC